MCRPTEPLSFRSQPVVGLMQGLADEGGDPIIIMHGTRRGGCGKSTTTSGLAYALAHRGYNVLAVSDGPEGVRRESDVSGRGGWWLMMMVVVVVE